MERPKCKDCCYFEEKYNQCRRNPPTSRYFPMVEPDDWCGELQPLLNWVVQAGVDLSNSTKSPGKILNKNGKTVQLNEKGEKYE